MILDTIFLCSSGVSSNIRDSTNPTSALIPAHLANCVATAAALIPPKGPSGGPLGGGPSVGGALEARRVGFETPLAVG